MYDLRLVALREDRRACLFAKTAEERIALTGNEALVYPALSCGKTAEESTALTDSFYP